MKLPHLSPREPLFMIDSTIDRYRWLVVSGDEKVWGPVVVAVRDSSVAQSWKPLPVEWFQETIARPPCDFPNFLFGIWAISRRARESLVDYLEPSGEFLALDGEGDEFVGYHCTAIVSAVDSLATAEALRQIRGGSFHSPRFVPTLASSLIPDADVFRVNESFSKTFVSDRFKKQYERRELTGLDFLEVPLS